MSKRMTTDELKRHIADALGELDELLNSWLYSSNEIDQKRAANRERGLWIPGRL